MALWSNGLVRNLQCAVFLLLATRPLGALLLREWLRGLEVKVPPFRVHKAQSLFGYNVNVAGGSCTGLQVADVKLLQALGSSDGLEVTLQTDVGVSCTLETNIEALGSHTCSVEFATAASEATLGLKVSSENQLPAKASGSCLLAPDLTEIHFKGASIVCDILRLGEAGVKALINEFASKVVCGEVSSWIDKNLTQALDDFRNAVLPYLGPADVLPVPFQTDEAVDLRHFLWEGPVGHVLRSFLKEVGHTDNPAEFDQVLGFLLQDLGLVDSKGSLSVPLRGLDLQAKIPGILNMLMELKPMSALLGNLTNISAMNLDFPQRLAVHTAGTMSPSAEMTLSAALLIPTGTASIDLRGLLFNITESQTLAPVLVRGGASAEVSGALQVFAAINRSGLGKMQIDQLQHLSCAPEFMVSAHGSPAQLLEARCAPELFHMQVNLPELSSSDLESELAAVAVGLLRAIGKAFGARATEVLDGFISSAGREAANGVLSSVLSKPPHCPASNFSAGEIRAVDIPARWTSGLLLGLTAVLSGAFLCSASWVRQSLPTNCLQQQTQQQPDQQHQQHPDEQLQQEQSNTGVQNQQPPLQRQLQEQSQQQSQPEERPPQQLSGHRINQRQTMEEPCPKHVHGADEVLLEDASPSMACGLPLHEASTPRALDIQLSGAGRAVGLGWDPRVSPFLRWGMITGIFGTISMFIIASVTPGVLITGYFEAATGTFETPNLSELSMDNSLAQMFSVGSYFVFFAMVIFSVIWPYVKLLLMLYCWVVPLKLTRGPLLVFLDQIGKWSLTDNFILFLFIVFFWIAWSGEDVVDGGAASFRLKCSPATELDTFLAATISSLVLGHAMLWIHRVYAEDKETRGQFRHSLPHRVCAGLGYTAALALMVASWCVEIVVVNFSGLIGTFLKVTGQPTTKRYSIVGIVLHLGTQGSAYLQVSMALFVLIIPALHLIAMLFLSVYPLPPKTGARLRRVCQTMSAWASFDVFFVAYLAAVLGGEKYGIAQFIQLIIYRQNVAPFCDGMQQIGVECLHIELTMLPGALLVAAAVAAWYVASLLSTCRSSPRVGLSR